MNPPKYILPVIVIAQFCCTSLWFAGNGVINDLVISYGLEETALGHLTSAVQFGFIIGTLLFAILSIADRFSPSKVFLISALLGSLFNLGVIWEGNSLMSLLSLRFLTGFFLAGIYPVGMKIAADYYEKGLGKSLGFLVGALVVGTAFPHLLKEFTGVYSWKYVLIGTSALAALGGGAMALLVPNGPLRRATKEMNLLACFSVFRLREFRSAALGYFGHMWELYAFWAFVPLMLDTYGRIHTESLLNIPLWSFLIIAMGGVACVAGGYIAERIGTRKTASLALILSSLCCLVAPFMFTMASPALFVSFLLFWSAVVIADSPLLSTLVAQTAKPEIKGAALTIVNSIGFAITIVSILLLTFLTSRTDSVAIYTILAIGPILGTLSLIGTFSKN